MEIPAWSFLQRQGMDAQLLQYEYAEGGGTADAARKLGVSEHMVVKSLVFRGEAGGVLALMHGDCRVSVRKLERAAHARRLWPASREEAQKFTGLQPGGICPYGAGLPVFVQSSLLALPRLYINAGARGWVVAMGPEGLAIPGFASVDILAASIKAKRDAVDR